MIFSGCGDCHAAAEFGASLAGLRTSLEARAFPAMELSRSNAHLLDERTLLVALSVSGRTPRVLEALRAAKRRGASVLAVTDNPEGPLAEEAPRVLLLGASPAASLQRTDYRDPEAAVYSGYQRAVPQTKTYGAVGLAVALICLELERSAPAARGTPRAELEGALARLPPLAERAAAAADAAGATLQEAVRPGCLRSFCGSGLGFSAARFSSYKLLELACPCSCADIEEYCHTLYLLTRPGDAEVFFAQDPGTLGRCREIAPVVAEELGAAPLVFHTLAESPAAAWEVCLPPVPPEVAPLLLAHAGAHLVRRLALGWGVSTDRFRAGVDEERYVRGSVKIIRNSEILEP